MTRILTVVDIVVQVVTALAIVISVPMFFIFGGNSAGLHGDSLAGYVQDGRCFAALKGGGYREVNCEDWQVNSAQGVIAFGSGLLAAFGGGYLALRALHASMDVSHDPVFAEREQTLRTSGPPQLEQNAGPRKAKSSLRILVFPAGLLVREAWEKPRVLLVTEITGLRTSTARYGEPWLEIHHSSTLCSSPVKLYTKPDGELACVIEQITDVSFTAAST